jgi:hypothetical protein
VTYTGNKFELSSQAKKAACDTYDRALLEGWEGHAEIYAATAAAKIAVVECLRELASTSNSWCEITSYLLFHADELEHNG